MRYHLLASVAPVAMVTVVLGISPVMAMDDGLGLTLQPSEQLAQAGGDNLGVLRAAAESGTLGDAVSGLLSGGATPEAVSAISDALAQLAASDPALAAQVAEAVANAASNLAGTDPQAAVDLASAALAVATNPLVQAANPDAANAAVASAAGGIQLAARAAQTQGRQLAGVENAQQMVDAAMSANPALETAVNESIDLADAQADLAGFATAAGGPAAGAGGAGGGGVAGVPAGITGNTAPTPTGFTPPTGTVGAGGGAGGGTTLTDPDPASPT